MIDKTDFILNKHGGKKYHYSCDNCGKDRGYLQITARGGRKTGSLCVRCKNGGSDTQESGGHCKFCNKTHTLPENGKSNEYWYWEPKVDSIVGGYLRCKQYMTNKAKMWNKENPEKAAAKNKRGADKYYSTTKGKLRSYISTRMRLKIKQRDYDSKFTNIGWTIEELIKHLESKFQPGMTWDNYGPMWHIDHVIPDSWFDYESINDEEFKQCWSLSNLQPL